MTDSDPLSRCGVDTVEVGRIERLLADTPREDLLEIFSEAELEDVGHGSTRCERLAARFAAKEACLKLFPRETALGKIGPADFTVERDGYGAPRVATTGTVQELLDRYRLSGIAISLTHTPTSASAVVATEPRPVDVPLSGRILYHLLPIRRRIVLSNLRLVFGDVLSEPDIVCMAQAFYAHLGRFVSEFFRFSWLSAERRARLVEVENVDALVRAHARGKGVLILAGHTGNWEVGVAAGLAQFPQYASMFHLPRKRLRPKLLDWLVAGRLRRMGLGILSQKGSLEAILDLLSSGHIVVFVLDQYSRSRKEGIEVEFFGHSVRTSRSLATIALMTGAPVVPAATWRRADGKHVLRFEEAVRVIEVDDPGRALGENTRAYNAALERMILRHPEQWFWMHRRWKLMR